MINDRILKKIRVFILIFGIFLSNYDFDFDFSKNTGEMGDVSVPTAPMNVVHMKTFHVPLPLS
jgi:hypothetical protein